jgi:serine/threonine-protein kinase HipA
MPEAYVYIYLEDGPVPAGVLETIGSGREATARFRYGRRYLQRKDRLTIDPIQLPLPDADSDRLYTAPEDFVLFNGIRDAAPDGWGRHLMDRAAGARPLSEFDYLVATGGTRVGALAFGPDLSGPKRIVPWTEQNLDGEDLDLKAMLEAVRDVDTADDLPRKHARFLSRGSLWNAAEGHDGIRREAVDREIRPRRRPLADLPCGIRSHDACTSCRDNRAASAY